MTERLSNDNKTPKLSDAKRLLLEKRMKREASPSNRKAVNTIGSKPTNAPDLATAGQTQIWLQNQTAPESPSNNIVSSFIVKGELNFELLEKSVNQVIERHKILKSSYVLKPEGLTRIQADNLHIKLSNITVTDTNEAAAQLAQTPFDIEKGPLIKMKAFNSRLGENLLVLVVHHIIFDLRSLQQFWSETSTFYREAIRRSTSNVTNFPIQYIDYAFHQRKECSEGKYDEQRSYWLKQLKNPPQAIKLPTDFPHPPSIGYSGNIQQRVIPAIQSDKIRKFAAENNATLAMALQFTFFVLLHRYSREDDILLATPISNREHKETTNLIGYFLNPLLIRLDFSKVDSVKAAFSLFKQTFLSALDHQSFPVSELTESLNYERVSGRHPLAQTMFVYQNSNEETINLNLEGCVCEPIFTDTRSSKFDLTLFASDTSPEIELKFEYRNDLFKEDTIKRAFGHFNNILDAIVDQPETLPGNIQFLNKNERGSRIAAGIGRKTNKILPTHFLDNLRTHALNTPNRTALIDSIKQYTYEEIEFISNRIAAALQNQGAEVNTVIGLYLEKSSEAVLAILGIIKSGAAYLPIDPNYPSKRCEYLIENSGTRLIICYKSFVPKIDSVKCSLLFIEDLLNSSEELKLQSAPNFDDSRLAYIIYTSGSTGSPKGVKISHKNLNSSIYSRLSYYPKSPKRFLLTPSLSFDSSIAGIFWTLSTGGELIIPSEEQARDSQKLARLIDSQAISTWLCVPTLYSQALKHLESQTLETVIVAGEICPTALVTDHFERLPKSALYNEYGPTEASVWATVHKCKASDTQLPSIPIGKPIPTATLRVLDANGLDVPIGHEGELFIGGAGVTLGYVGETSLNQGAFIIIDETRYYRTGDQVKWNESGSLLFIGRSDTQVKLRGYRIETGEVEATFNTHPTIEQTVVVIGNDYDALPDWNSIIKAVPENALKSALEKIKTESSIPKSKSNRNVANSEFTIEYHQHESNFLSTPRKTQRDWLINQALAEVSDDLKHLDNISSSFVKGYGKETDERIDDVESSRITKDEIMESWQYPIMEAMAKYATESHGDVLEIGFGRGVSAEYIQEQSVKSHTIIEMDDAIIEKYFEPWRKNHDQKDIRIHEGRWQDAIENLDTFDSIFFHTYPMNEEEFVEYILNSVTFAAHAFPSMAKHLKKGGVFTYFTAEIDSISRRHQRKLLEHFSEISFRIIDLEIPENTKDAWWSKTIAVIKAVK